MSGLPKANGFVTTPSVLAIATLDSPPTYIDIANIGDIANNSNRGEANVSAHGAEAARFVGTLLEEGTYTFPLFFIADDTTSPEDTHTDPTNGLYAIYKRNDLRAFALFLRDENGTARYFNGFIKQFSEKLPVNGVHTADVVIRIDDRVLTGTESGGPGTAVFAPPEA